MLYNTKTHVYSSTSAEFLVETDALLEPPSNELSDRDSDDDCFIVEDSQAESDEEQWQGDNSSDQGNADCSSSLCDAECCRMEELLTKPYQVRREYLNRD